MPRKGYTRQPGRSAGMPERMEAQTFNRRISASEALVLSVAGNGSKTEGFRNLLSLYQELHNLGYRCSMELTTFIIGIKISTKGNKLNYLNKKLTPSGA